MDQRVPADQGAAAEGARPDQGLLADQGALSEQAADAHGPQRLRGRAGADAPSGDLSSLVVRCLGGFGIEVADRPVDLTLVKPRAQAALRLLALHAGRPVHRESMVEALWPEAGPDTGSHRLQVAISSLRRVLAGAWGTEPSILREGGTYRLALPKGAFVDLTEFEAALVEGRAQRRLGEPAMALVALARAREIYAGELLPEDGPAEWVVKERQRLRLAATEVAESLAELRLEAGDGPGAAAACEWGLQVDRYHDGMWRLLVRAHEEAGDRAASRRARRGYDAALAELGLPPSAPRGPTGR